MATSTMNLRGSGLVNQRRETKRFHGWKKGKKISRGAFGTVCLCTRSEPSEHFPENFQAALKIIDKSKQGPKQLSKLHREVDIMLEVGGHPNIVQIFDVQSTTRKLYIVMELCKGGELFSEGGRENVLEENYCRNVITQLLTALAHMHSHSIAHRDLKPGNVLFADKERTIIKITDFGLSKSLHNDSEKFQTKVGTPYFCSPEIVNTSITDYTVKCDIWSTGVMLFILLVGYFPFYSEKAYDLYRLILDGEFEFDEEYWSDMSDDVKDLITNMLQVEVEDRLSAQECLEHPWITQVHRSRREDVVVPIIQLNIPPSNANVRGSESTETAPRKVALSRSLSTTVYQIDQSSPNLIIYALIAFATLFLLVHDIINRKQEFVRNDLEPLWYRITDIVCIVGISYEVCLRIISHEQFRQSVLNFFDILIVFLNWLYCIFYEFFTEGDLSSTIVLLCRYVFQFGRFYMFVRWYINRQKSTSAIQDIRLDKRGESGGWSEERLLDGSESFHGRQQRSESAI